MGESERFSRGLAVRREVLGAAYVDASMAKADDFLMAFQEMTTEWCWGYAWTRPGLERRIRSMLNLARRSSSRRRCIAEFLPGWTHSRSPTRCSRPRERCPYTRIPVEKKPRRSPE
jgi:hypothetical protein